jgi:two-component sensor histidine kinase
MVFGFLYSTSIAINNEEKSINVLAFSSIYLDHSQSMSIEDVQKQKFQTNSQSKLSYGYSPNFNVWIRFTLVNNSSTPTTMELEYANPLTQSLELYNIEDGTMQKEGTNSINNNRNSVNPLFTISMEANSSKTYYLKASTTITPLIIDLKLWKSKAFYSKELTHQTILSLFFGSILILALYNFSIYFFTRDKSYLFYVLYLFGMSAHQLVYVGMAAVFDMTRGMVLYYIEYSTLFVTATAIALTFFTKSFIGLEKFPIVNKIVDFFTGLLVIVSLISLNTKALNQMGSLLPFMMLVLLMIITFYVYLKGNERAKFIVVAWVIFFISGMFMFLSSYGVFSIQQSIPYVVELFLVLEALIFSIALAKMIKFLQSELLRKEEDEKKLLEQTVEVKTIDLEKALAEKEFLLKELNHRVKNNMQMIVSLIRLQLDKASDDCKELLGTVHSRISAMSQLHELLVFKDQVDDIDANEYFMLLTDEIEESFQTDVKINFDIRTQLKLEEAIYCGLIMHELITNAFKYAFVNKMREKIIHVSFQKQNSIYQLIVEDNGIGFTHKKSSRSLGFLLIDSLVNRLGGTLNVTNNNGAKIEIEWKEK